MHAAVPSRRIAVGDGEAPGFEHTGRDPGYYSYCLPPTPGLSWWKQGPRLAAGSNTRESFSVGKEKGEKKVATAVVV